jgi:hypothetical protein
MLVSKHGARGLSARIAPWGLALGSIACSASAPSQAKTSGSEAETSSVQRHAPTPPSTNPPPPAAPGCNFEAFRWRLSLADTPNSSRCPESFWVFTADLPGTWRASEQGCTSVQGIAHVEGSDLIVDGSVAGTQIKYVWHASSNACGKMRGVVTTASGAATAYQLEPVGPAAP